MTEVTEVSPALRALLRLSAELATGGEAEWREALLAARERAGVRAIEEVVLQSYLFVGFPVVLRALAVWRELVPASEDDVPEAAIEARRAAGEALCRRIYGPAYDRLRSHVSALHPDLDRWMVEEGYGKTLSRPGPGVAERELCVVALLGAAGHEPQLRSHLRGALNVGATRAQVEAALEVGLTVATANAGRAGPDADGLRAAWKSILERVERAGRS